MLSNTNAQWLERAPLKALVHDTHASGAIQFFVAILRSIDISIGTKELIGKRLTKCAGEFPF